MRAAGRAHREYLLGCSEHTAHHGEGDSDERRPPTACREIDDDVFDFSGRFVVSDATISFTARQAGSHVVYRSNPDGQISFDAGVGRERNGVFR